MCLCNRNFHDSLPGKPINSWEINGSRIKEEAGDVSKLPLKFRKTQILPLSACFDSRSQILAISLTSWCVFFANNRPDN